MTDYAVVRVRLWGRNVGILGESDSGRVTFEYDPAFRASGLEISPLHLPLQRRGSVAFPELGRKPAFMGLPGVFADALPDRFGNSIIRRYFADRAGQPTRCHRSNAFSISEAGRWARSSFAPPGPGGEHRGGPRTARAGRAGTPRHRRRRVGGCARDHADRGSAGGARPKALILWNRSTNRIRSGFARPEPGEEPWLIKFDGVTRDPAGQGMRGAREPGPWGRIEYAYARMAGHAGIRMAETHLLRDGDFAHFMTRRFDRASGEAGESRLHFHSLGGLQHIDFNDQYVFSYEGYFDTIRAIGLGQRSVNEAFRRMVFNVATVNFDDHVKNFGFLMNSQGRWRLAPRTT